MSMPQFCRVFEKSDTYFNGYFSNEKITDIEEAYIASTITQDDLTIRFPDSWMSLWEICFS